MTFGEIKRNLEELTKKEVKYDDKGLVFTISNITYHLGYDGNNLVLTNDLDKSKMCASYSAIICAIKCILSNYSI